MRIAFVVGKFPALSETFILNQITGLIDRGHAVDIFATRPEVPACPEEVARYGLLARTRYAPAVPRNPLVRAIKAAVILGVHGWKDVPKAIGALNGFRYGREAWSLRLLFAVAPFLGRATRRYDVLHCHFGNHGLRGMFLRDVKALDGRLVTTFHGADVSRSVRRYGAGVYERLFASGDLFLPVSERWRRRLIDLGCPASRIRVHHMGIDCRLFAFRHRQPDPERPVRLISVCRLVEKKGIQYGIRAVAALATSGRAITYDIVGDGPMRRPLLRLIEALDVGAVVKMHGWKSNEEVRIMLQSAHALLAPSVKAGDDDHEGIPVALMEAMASGLPVISTRHSGIPELVEDGRSGLLADEGDVASLRERIEYLLDHPALWPEMARHARKRVEQLYDIRRLNDRLLGLFEELLAAGGIDPRAEPWSSAGGAPSGT